MNARQTNIAALLTAAGAVLMLFISAPDLFPAVPVGTLVLAAAAAIVAMAPGRWPSAVGTVVPAFILVGAVASDQSADILQGSENPGAIIATVIQLLALVVAIAAGVACIKAGR